MTSTTTTGASTTLPGARSRVSRRTFIAGAGAASVLVLGACKPVPPGSPVGATTPPGPGPTSTTTAPATTTTTAPARVPSDPLLRSAWTPLVGQSVALVGAAGTVSAVLDGIEDLGPTPADERSFSLAFRGEPSQDRLDLVDRVRTGSEGQRAIVATPSDRGVDHHWYHAIVFNPAV